MKILWRVFVLFLLVAATVWLAWHRDAFDRVALEGWILKAGAGGWALHVAIYALGTVLFLPGSLLTLAGGALFGPVVGTALNLTGASLGAGISFLLARYVASDWVQRKAGGNLRRLMDGVDGEGWRFVAFVRLVPVFPFNLLNYALGLTRIPFGNYLVTSAVCMIPGCAAYTYLGYAGREAVTGGEGMIQKGMIGLALLAVAIFIPSWVKKWRAGRTSAPEGWVEIPVEVLKEQVDRRTVVVLDVRDGGEFHGALGHIHGAVNVPMSELEGRLSELRDLARPLAVVCHSDIRSAKAVQMLVEAGVGGVALVKGGMLAWRQAGYPVE